MYYETFDNINCIKDCSNQTVYQIYVHLQEIFKKALKEQDWKDDLQIVIQNYGVNEFDIPSLKAQLPSLKTQLLLLFETASSMVSRVECSFQK